MVDIVTAITGVVLVIIAMFCFNFAIVLQKMGLKEGPEIPFDKGIKGIILAFWGLAKNKKWLIGAIMGIGAWFPYIISIGMVGIMVAVPINSMGIVVFVFIAHRYLDEKIRWFEFLAISLLAISPILIVFSGISIVIIDLHRFVIPFVIFIVVTGSITIVCFILSRKKKGTNLEGFFIMLTGAFLLAIGNVFTNILAQAIVQANIQLSWYVWAEILFAIFWFTYYHLWVFIGWWGLVVCNLGSFAFYQSAFQKSRAVMVYPILNTIGIVLPIIAGIFVFQQTFENYILFFVAIVLIFIGTTALGRFQTVEQELEKIE